MYLLVLQLFLRYNSGYFYPLGYPDFKRGSTTALIIYFTIT